jgi:hypothetical protein
MFAFTGLVPGMKKEKGKTCPYNQWLKSKMMGVLASCFIKSNSPYREFYDNYKNRKMNDPKYIEEIKENKKKNPKSKGIGHIDNMAKRYMIKQFLKDLYVQWRTVEGLPVRNFYEEEYLGKFHNFD